MFLESQSKYWFIYNFQQVISSHNGRFLYAFNDLKRG